MLGQKSWNPFKKEDPRELVRKWQSAIRKEVRAVERQQLDLQREQRKAVKLVKDAAKESNLPSAKIIAKEIVTIRRTIGKLAVNKATLMSLSAQLSEQLAMARVAGTLSKSTECMQLVNSLLKIPDFQAVMRDMSKEMFKAGVLEEMVSETMDSALDEAAAEEETEEAIDKVLMEVAGETIAQMASVPERRHAAAAAVAAEESEEEDALAARLAAVRS